MEIRKALEELRKEKKRKFDQTLDIIVNLKNYDVRKEALNTFITLPHPTEKSVAAFLTKRSPLVDTITEPDFEKYKDLKSIKKLARKYDAFIAAAPLMTKIASKFGRVFGPLGKMPNPQLGIIVKEDEESIKSVLEKIKKSIRVRNKEKSIKLPVGKYSMKDSDLEENITFVLSSLEKILPKSKENIEEVLIKFTMTKPVKIL